MNAIVNKLFECKSCNSKSALTWDKFMPEMHLKNLGLHVVLVVHSLTLKKE